MRGSCSVINCSRDVLAKTLCRMHYQRLRNTGTVGKAQSQRIFSEDGKCTVNGCSKPYFGKGFCAMHYMRLRSNGTLNTIIAERGEPLRYIKDVVLVYENKNKCLIWPYAKNTGGYGQVWFKNKQWLVSRLVCQKINGKPPTKQHEACHSCGNGHSGCVNKHHLRWGTHSENEQDKIKHGTYFRGIRGR